MKALTALPGRLSPNVAWGKGPEGDVRMFHLNLNFCYLSKQGRP